MSVVKRFLLWIVEQFIPERVHSDGHECKSEYYGGSGKH